VGGVQLLICCILNFNLYANINDIIGCDEPFILAGHVWSTVFSQQPVCVILCSSDPWCPRFFLQRFENIFGGKIDRHIVFEERLCLAGHMCRASKVCWMACYFLQC